MREFVARAAHTERRGIRTLDRKVAMRACAHYTTFDLGDGQIFAIVFEN
jgi:hypothetical protein